MFLQEVSYRWKQYSGDLQAVIMLPTGSVDTTNHQSFAPCAHKSVTGYQPYPAIPPTATTGKY